MTHNNVLLKFTVNIVLVALNKCILFMSPRHTSFIDIYMYFSDKIQVYFLFFGDLLSNQNRNHEIVLVVSTDCKREIGRASCRERV